MFRKQEIKIRKLFDLVINDYRDNKRKSLSTLATHIDNHLEPFFGERSAERLKVSDVEAYKDQRKNEGAKNATINLELAALRRAYSLGVEKELVSNRPKIKLYQIGKSNRRTGFFEHDEFEKQLEALPPYGKQVLRFGYECGWRQGEIFSLTWAENYDESGQVIRLNDSKNGNGRIFPLRDPHRKLTEAGQIIEEQKWNRVKGCDLIFHSRGKPIQRVTFHRHWRKACVASGVARHFHDLRRTVVRNLTRAGVHRTIAKAVTGHETDDVFERYDIVDEADLKQALSKMSSYLSGRNGGTSQNTPTHHDEQNEQSEEATASGSDKSATSAVTPPSRELTEPDDVLSLMAELGVV